MAVLFGRTVVWKGKSLSSDVFRWAETKLQRSKEVCYCCVSISGCPNEFFSQISSLARVRNGHTAVGSLLVNVGTALKGICFLLDVGHLGTC